MVHCQPTGNSDVAGQAAIRRRGFKVLTHQRRGCPRPRSPELDVLRLPGRHAWTALDTQSLPGPFENRRQTKEFTTTNQTAYAFYKFDFTPKPGVSHFQVSEIALAGVNLGGQTSLYVSSPSEHADGVDTRSGILASLDGSPATAWVARQPWHRRDLAGRFGPGRVPDLLRTDLGRR